MFCNACGRKLQPGEQYCTACGQPVGVAPIPRSINRVAHHVHLLGIFWIVYALLEVMGSIIAMVFATTIVGILSRLPETPVQFPSFFLAIFIVATIFLLCKSSLGLIAGLGLLQRRPWARILAIILGVLVLMNIPFGTALGVYTLWTLLSPESEQEYGTMARDKNPGS